MKKQRKKPQTKQSSAPIDATVQAQKAKDESRRNFLRLARNGAIALPVLAGIGYFSVKSVQATISETDLTKIHDGKPSVVQIHDPNCSLCQTLQSQARKALKSFDDDAVTFLVANINTLEGSTFAAHYGVPHITLLLFDAKGEMIQVVRGPTNVDNLRTIFTAHLAAHS